MTSSAGFFHNVDEPLNKTRTLEDTYFLCTMKIFGKSIRLASSDSKAPTHKIKGSSPSSSPKATKVSKQKPEQAPVRTHEVHSDHSCSTKSMEQSLQDEREINRALNIKCAEQMLDHWNNFRGVDAMLECFSSKKALFAPEDFPALSVEVMAQGHINLMKSFPDMKFTYKKIIEEEPNLVRVEGLVCSGTHTGEPYSMAPGFPAIPATGKFCQNDEEQLYVTLVDNKIEKVEIVAFGSVTGPAGFYEQIGGDLVNGRRSAKQ